MRNSIQQDLSIRISFFILCIGIVTGGGYYFLATRYHETEFNRAVEQQTEHLADAFTLQLWLYDFNTTQKLCMLTVESPEVSGIRLQDHNKRIIFEQISSPNEAATHLHKELHHGKDRVGYLDIYYTNTEWER